MYVVKNNHPDTPFTLSFTVTDAEGNTLPASSVTVETISDNPDAVSVIPVAGDQSKGVLHFGNAGLANISVTVKQLDGTLLGSFGAQFTVTLGDVVGIAGGSIVVEGLSES